MLRRMLEGVTRAGPLMGGEEEGRFLGQKEEIGLPPRKSEGKKAVGLSLRGRSRIRKGRAFHGLALFGEARMKRLPE